MALIEWQERFNIGIASVDHEHRELVELLNALHAELSAGARYYEMIDFLGEVFAQISAHFALEEREMRERGYDQYAEHKEAHEALLDEIRDIMDDYEEGAYESPAADLGVRLERWFGEHFRTHDARLHKTLQG